MQAGVGEKRIGIVQIAKAHMHIIKNDLAGILQRGIDEITQQAGIVFLPQHGVAEYVRISQDPYSSGAYTSFPHSWTLLRVVEQRQGHARFTGAV